MEKSLLLLFFRKEDLPSFAASGPANPNNPLKIYQLSSDGS